MYVFSGDKRDTNAYSSSNLNVRPIAIIRWIKYYNFISRIDESDHWAIQPFDSTIYDADIVLRIDLSEGRPVKFSDCVDVLHWSKRARVLVIAYLAWGLLLSIAYWRCCLKKLGGSQVGEPWPRLMDLVRIARRVIILQIVGWLNPASRSASTLSYFMQY